MSKFSERIISSQRKILTLSPFHPHFLGSFKIPLYSPGGVKKIHSWFESLTTNGFYVSSFKHLAVRPPSLKRAVRGDLRGSKSDLRITTQSLSKGGDLAGVTACECESANVKLKVGICDER
jgi:hypothetical protein